MLDLSKYAARIHTAEDKPLFEEAANCANAGARRAAYVMIWLSCAESLKRRFREAQKRDGAAGKIVGDFEQKEKDQKSVDRFLLEKAKEYGFLSDSAHTILVNVYELRCLYGHPYEEAPTPEQVTHAAAMVVEHVLAHPVRLRHGFGKTLMKSLLEEKNYLDDQASAVETFASEIMPKIDGSIVSWLLDSYWPELEKMADDASLSTFFKRGVWFTSAVLSHAGTTVYSPDQWHDKVGKFPKTLVRVLTKKPFFEAIGSRAQDSIIGAAFDQVKERASVLQYLDRLYQAGAFTERQRERFTECLAGIKPDNLRVAGISLKTCFRVVIDALESHNWYTQKPAVDLVVAQGPGAVKELDAQEQDELGRNILQAADGSESSARKFLTVLTKEARKWPLRFVKGIALECFANEDNQIRLKHECLEDVLKILDRRKPAIRAKILDAITLALQEGEPKRSYLGGDTFKKALGMIDGYEWGAELSAALKKRRKDLVTRSDDNDE